MHVLQYLDGNEKILKEQEFTEREAAFDAYERACGVVDRGGGPDGTVFVTLSSDGHVHRRHRSAKAARVEAAEPAPEPAPSPSPKADPEEPKAAGQAEHDDEGRARQRAAAEGTLPAGWSVERDTAPPEPIGGPKQKTVMIDGPQGFASSHQVNPRKQTQRQVPKSDGPVVTDVDKQAAKKGTKT